VPGEHDGNAGPARLADRHGGIAHRLHRALEPAPDPRERPLRVAEAVLHVHDEQRAV